MVFIFYHSEAVKSDSGIGDIRKHFCLKHVAHHTDGSLRKVSAEDEQENQWKFTER